MIIAIGRALWWFTKVCLFCFAIGEIAMLGMIALHLLFPQMFPDPTR